MDYINVESFEFKNFSFIKKEEYISVLNNYFLYLDNHIIDENIDILDEDIASVLLVINTFFDYFKDKDYWIDKIFYLIKKVEKIFKNKSLNSLGFFGGFSDLEYAVYIVSQKLGLFKNFYNYINDVYLELVLLKLKFAKKNIDNLKILDYDFIFGFAGIGYNILKKEFLNEKETKIIFEISTYLTDLCSDYNYKGFMLPKFHIKSENQIRDDEKIDFKNGNINYGFSHGMGAVLLFLSKSYSLGYISDIKKIEYIFKLYEKNEILRDGYFMWSTQQSFEEFINNETNDFYRSDKASFCYGYLGITSALLKSCEYIKNIDILEKYKNNLKNILRYKNIEEFNLSNVIICHGFSYLLLVYQKYDNQNKVKIKEIYDKIMLFYDEKFELGFLGKDVVIVENREVVVESFGLSLLEGSSGIILALASFFIDVREFVFHIGL